MFFSSHLYSFFFFFLHVLFFAGNNSVRMLQGAFLFNLGWSHQARLKPPQSRRAGGGVGSGAAGPHLLRPGAGRAAGLSTSSNILLGSVGSAFGAWLAGSKKGPSSSPPAEEEKEAEEKEPKENKSQAELPKPPIESEEK
uniref:Uncharacterized protein n=1 Tax=Neovison vison TaxID=452646 RepID=A0A8C7AEK6_NEOVI